MSTSEDDRHCLRLSLLRDHEVVFGQVADEVALLVGDDRVDLDVVDLDLEGNRRLVRRWLGRRGLLGACSEAVARQASRIRNVRPGV